jgi:hypothetical protein
MPGREAPGMVSRARPAPKEVHVSRLRVLERNGNFVEVTDLDTAAFLHQRGVAVSTAVRVGKSMHVITMYDPLKAGMETGRAEELAIEFINSEAALFADAVRRLKKVIHRFGGKKRR